MTNSARNVIPALKNGQITEVKPEDAKYEFVSPNQFFNESINLLPAQNAVTPARAFYSNKFIAQSLPIVDGDAPFVQSLKDAKKNESFEDYLGRQTGVVTLDDDDDEADIIDVTPDYIKYKNKKGQIKTKDLYNNFIFNRKTSVTNIPLVKKGDKIFKNKNPILARTNYTNKDGTLNMGKNARVAFVAYKGWSADDAIVISDEFAKKLKSHHMYQYLEDEDKSTQTGLKHYVSLFPNVFKNDQLKNIDENGVIKVGSLVNPGDPIILSTKPRMISSKDQTLGKLSKFIKNTRNDASIKWDHDYVGHVTDVVKTKDGYKVNIECEAPAKIGDKISVRSGSKTTISKIIPVDQMPRTEDGKPVDVLFNHLGLVSRVNSNMIMESLLGKIAEKTGRIYKIPTFNKNNDKWYEYVEGELKKYNIPDKERLYDPIEDRYLEQPVTVGNNFFLKLHHTSDSKLSARGQGIYDQNAMPLKGGDEGAKAKRISGLETTALLSAGAYGFLKDAIHLRGQKNDEYWRQVRMGLTPQLSASTPFIWNKYLAILKGTGINAIQTKDGLLKASPFTDKQFDLLDPVEINNSEIVDFKDMKPVKGGLFDETMSLTNRWGKITLDRPYPNPGFEDYIAALTNMKKSDIIKLISGEKVEGINNTGSQVILDRLKSIDMDSLFDEAKHTFNTGPRSKQAQALKIMQIIKGLKSNNLKPEDLMITKVPVIPAAFRPYSARGDTFIPGDANELYQDVFNINKIQKDIKAQLGEDEANKNAINVYNSIKALYGFADSKNKKLQQRGVSGFLNKLIGKTSKFAMFNRSVVSKPVDFSGRAVVDVNPELSMDEIMLPKDMAFELFAPYIQRELVQRGMSYSDSLKAVQAKSQEALNALNQVIKERPVMYSRAPSWHKFNTLGGWVKLHDGKNILTNPLISSGMGMDYDGDMQINHVFVAIPKS